MKTTIYRCDSCEKTITNPYVVKMKEFYIDSEFHFGLSFLSENKKQKIKVHLCDNCYRGLSLSAEMKRRDNNAEIQN